MSCTSLWFLYPQPNRCDVERVLLEGMQSGDDLLGLYYLTASELSELLMPSMTPKGRHGRGAEVEAVLRLQTNPNLKRRHSATPATVSLQLSWSELAASSEAGERRRRKSSVGGMDGALQESSQESNLGVLTVELEAMRNLVGKANRVKPRVEVKVGAQVRFTPLQIHSVKEYINEKVLISLFCVCMPPLVVHHAYLPRSSSLDPVNFQLTLRPIPNPDPLIISGLNYSSSEIVLMFSSSCSVP